MQAKTERTSQQVSAVILAGGRGQRMANQDKGLLQFQHRSYTEWLITQLQPQVKQIYINANRNLSTYQQFGYPVISDPDPSAYLGPLTGIETILSQIQTPYLLTIPCDNPLLSPELLSRFWQAKHANYPCIANDGHHLQPLYALIPKTLSLSLKKYLQQSKAKVLLWYQQQQAIIVDYSDQKKFFSNINTPEQKKAFNQTASYIC